mgnify:FL=1
MENPKVSVIIPNYNHELYLDERIQSVLNQSYKDFEVIILDDVSKDNSRNVIEKYRSNPHVSHIVYNTENSGSTFKQWAKGFSLAKGELIWIAESDDSCSPELLQKLVNEFEKDNELVLAYSLSMFIDEHGNQHKPANNVKRTVHLDGKDYIQRYMEFGNHIKNASCALFKKDVAVNLNQIYTHYKGSGDRMFWILIAEQGRVVIVDELLNYFRRYSSTTTSKMTLNGTNHKEELETYHYLCSHHLLDGLHRFLVRAYNKNEVLKNHYSSKEVEDELRKIWKVPNSQLDFSILIIKVVNFLQNKFKIYI